MDVECMGSDLEVLGSCGVVLSVEQRAQLQSSLVLLKTKCKFRRIGLWGVILGISGNYFIAVGVGRDELGDRKYLYRYNMCSKSYKTFHVICLSAVKTVISGLNWLKLTALSWRSALTYKVALLDDLSTSTNSSW